MTDSQKTYVIKCEGYARGIPCEFTGQYLEWYKPNGDPMVGLGKWTDKLDQAMTFKTAGEATECWRQERTVSPSFRADGKPDRPLTAFNISVIPFDQAKTD